MKSQSFFLLIFIPAIAFSQTGNVGINTTNPVRTLDIEGTLRVKTVLDKSADGTYTNILIQNPTTGAVDAISKSSLATPSIEPWNIQNTSTGATTNTQNIYQNSKVGIGDFSTVTANEKLEVQGNIKNVKSFITGMGNVDNTNPSNFTNVAINETTGELVKVKNVSNSSALSYLTFKITTTSGQDYIQNFNTRINSSEYTVLLINAIFNVGKLNLTDNNRVAPFNYGAYVENGTWRLTADYVDVAPALGSTYTWDLVCLVIQNTQIKNIGNISKSLDSNNNGDMGTPIPGL